MYRFGDGQVISATKNVDLPAILGSQPIILNIDIVANDIPLLLSRKAMKNAGVTLDFENDNATVFGNLVKLITTKSGHYAIPISPYCNILNNIVSGNNPNVTLTITQQKSKYDIGLKLHRQFLHPTPNKLICLLNSAGDSWVNDNELKDVIHKISNDCQTCKLYRKTPPRPVLELPMATKFPESVSIDLKFYNGKILLHLVDHATKTISINNCAIKET